MSRRYAPTLLVGLGGSGMAVLRYLKRRTGLRFSKDEPLVYLGVDLDQSSRFARLQEIEAPEEAADVKKAACSDADPAWTLDLADDEQQYFDPKKIENCIRNLNREYGGATDEGRRFAFDYIRNWFPGRGDEDFRGAQVTASGARQWRPLGRVGFFLNVRDIVSNIGSAARKLGRLLLPTVRVGDSPMIYLISSLSGGTGSGMLHDVAANLRRELPDYPLLAFLILPEVFSMH